MGSVKTLDSLDPLEWEMLDDASKINEIVEGTTVIGAEPIGYPLTDGLILYLKRADGTTFALATDASDYLFSDTDDENPFAISTAEVPAAHR